MSHAIVAHRPGEPDLRAALMPQTFEEVLRFAEMVSQTQFVPPAFRGKPNEVLAAITYGAELGLSPMQSLRGIAVINGTPAAFGDTILAICQTHPSWEGKEEWVDGSGDDLTAHCVVKRKGEQDVHATFSVADAQEAGLWNKPGPWKQYRRRMLMFRARGFALRDQFADALRGLITAEEAGDYPQAHAGRVRAPYSRRSEPPTIEADQLVSVYDQFGEEFQLQPGEVEAWFRDRVAECDAEQLKALAEVNADTLPPAIVDVLEQALGKRKIEVFLKRDSLVLPMRNGVVSWANRVEAIIPAVHSVDLLDKLAMDNSENFERVRDADESLAFRLNNLLTSRRIVLQDMEASE